MEQKKDIKKKAKTPEITDKVEVDFEPTLDNTVISEVLSVAARMKKRQQIRRYRSKMKIARKRSLKRRATQSRIQQRARRSALSAVKKKIAGGRAANTLTYSERARVERLAKRRRAVVQRTARRMVVGKRAIERRRLTGAPR